MNSAYYSGYREHLLDRDGLPFDRAAYSGTALAFRDRLIIEWNRTQQRQTLTDQKRVYCKFEALIMVEML